jgi:hypothetical protein
VLAVATGTGIAGKPMQRITIVDRRIEMPADVRFAIKLALGLIPLVPIDLAIQDAGYVTASHFLAAGIIAGTGYVLKLVWPYRHAY